MKALVVDDSKAIRSILRKTLKEIGVEVIAEATHGVEALSRLRETGPLDLTLVDWNMPEMNGFDFLCAVRRDRAYDALTSRRYARHRRSEQLLSCNDCPAVLGRRFRRMSTSTEKWLISQRSSRWRGKAVSAVND